MTKVPKTKTAPAKRYCRRRGIREHRVGKQIFLADDRLGRIHALNTVSSGIWNLLGEPQNKRQLLSILAQAFREVPRERLSRDVALILRRFEDAGVIREVKPNAAAPPQKRKRLARLT